MVSRIKKFGNFIYEDLLSDITAKANGEYEGLKKTMELYKFHAKRFTQ
jgi:hypothetical protein